MREIIRKIRRLGLEYLSGFLLATEVVAYTRVSSRMICGMAKE